MKRTNRETQTPASQADNLGPYLTQADIDAYVQRALDAREAQGLPRYVTDPDVLERAAQILNGESVGNLRVPPRRRAA